MAQLLKQLIRKKTLSTRLFTTLSHQKPPLNELNLTPLLFPINKSIFNQVATINPIENGIEFGSHLRDSQIYPSFSIGFFLNPVLQNGLSKSQLDVVVGDEMEQNNGMIWADSVKKKRKKKMNKHKYKKLRKRLRRKTKA